MAKRRLGWILVVAGVSGLLFSLLILKSQSVTAPGSDISAPSSSKPDKKSVDDYRVAPDLPKYIGIPAINVDRARIIGLGLTKKDQIASPDNIYDAGWYDSSAKPGQSGAMFIYGHVSSWTADGVFHDLNRLRPGDNVFITRGDDKKFTYRVVSSKVYPANKVDMRTVLAPIAAGKPGLNLMTCTGHVIKGTSEFDERLVVFTTLASN